MKRPTWSGDWPIPRVVPLPGMRVRVRVVPPEKCPYKYGAFVYVEPTGEHPHATVLINGQWPIEMQRYILWHELVHAVNDGIDQMVEKFPDHVQTHSMATMAGLKAAEASAALAPTEAA
jgi:hypothetical protein